jgi:hypothetical protein
LYALGVAGLASKKLQQKHSRPQFEKEKIRLSRRKETSTSTAVLVEKASDSTESSSGKQVEVLSALVSILSALLRASAVHRMLLRRYKSCQMKAALVFLARTYKSGPGKSAKALWMIGSGKKNVAWTCTIMKAQTLLLLHPLVQGIASEKTVVEEKAELC